MVWGRANGFRRPSTASPQAGGDAGRPGRGGVVPCSDDADYITGQALNVDGGMEMN
ncbi:MAG: hypothetical protein IPK19_00160 [Chloroflexi bacterium]|nr:hypothetical protein [Chloroflexota bacterium]